MALVDEQRQFVEINDALLSILGARRGEIMGASVVDAIPSSERALAQREWDAFLRSGEYSGGGPIVRLDGQEVEIEVAARLTAVGGRPLAVCVVTSASHLGRRSGRHRRGADADAARARGCDADRTRTREPPDRRGAVRIAFDCQNAREKRYGQARRAYSRAIGRDRTFAR